MELIPMTPRQKIISYSKGNYLNGFWRLFDRRQRAKNKYVQDFLAFFVSRQARKHGGYIGNGATFATVPRLPHGLHGIYISRYANVGTDCWIYQNVTIGEVRHKAPQIGDYCLIGAGAVLVGDIKIGNNVKIGAGAVVSTDVPDDCTVVCAPPRILKRNNRDE